MGNGDLFVVDDGDGLVERLGTLNQLPCGIFRGRGAFRGSNSLDGSLPLHPIVIHKLTRASCIFERYQISDKYDIDTNSINELIDGYAIFEESHLSLRFDSVFSFCGGGSGVGGVSTGTRHR
ncbi:Hypothetical predicted protein [Octopus vulgaris]|uniref:Uncharacterized protein n=1 Tax=Octopus vulgaris TaxID=6645 RepID=A0AA36BN75_OCTVU|nr:Hypothetical predicted protein [Octopus vulgaris]